VEISPSIHIKGIDRTLAITGEWAPFSGQDILQTSFYFGLFILQNGQISKEDLYSCILKVRIKNVTFAE